jgi:hypothetical protein
LIDFLFCLQAALDEREGLMAWLLSEVSRKLPSLRRLKTEENPISVALAVEGDEARMLGSMLFTRGLTGKREKRNVMVLVLFWFVE